MITVDFVKIMARYNQWQNGSIYAAASRLGDADRKADRGIFFGSIHATLNHVLWADQMWLMRFGAAQAPVAKSLADGLHQHEDWDELTAQRVAFDTAILNWADAIVAADLAGDLNWISGATGRAMQSPKGLAVTHLFNHQTHHRGQVHGLLTGFGIKPDMTDLPFAPFLT